MSDELSVKNVKEKTSMLEILEAIIEQDMVQQIMAVPHLTLAERRIAVGRALRKGIAQELAKQLVNEEVTLAAIDGRAISDALAEALVTAAPLPLFRTRAMAA